MPGVWSGVGVGVQDESEAEELDLVDSEDEGARKKRRLCRFTGCTKLDKGRGHCKQVSRQAGTERTGEGRQGSGRALTSRPPPFPCLSARRRQALHRGGLRPLGPRLLGAVHRAWRRAEVHGGGLQQERQDRGRLL